MRPSQRVVRTSRRVSGWSVVLLGVVCWGGRCFGGVRGRTVERWRGPSTVERWLRDPAKTHRVEAVTEDVRASFGLAVAAVMASGKICCRTATSG